MLKELLGVSLVGTVVASGLVIGGICKVAYIIHNNDQQEISALRATNETQRKVIDDLLKEKRRG